MLFLLVSEKCRRVDITGHSRRIGALIVFESEERTFPCTRSGIFALDVVSAKFNCLFGGSLEVGCNQARMFRIGRGERLSVRLLGGLIALWTGLPETSKGISLLILQPADVQ